MNIPAEDQRSRIIDEAADWLARMHGNAMSAADKQAWEQWLQQSPAHQYVWQQAQQLSRQLGGVETTLGMSVLNRRRSGVSRRQLLSSLTLLLAAPAASWWGFQLFQNRDAVFYTTATGERRDVFLPDGSEMAMNTASRVQLKFNNEQRLLKHLAGEIWLQTAQDAAARPFLVATGHGQLRALGTRFLVRSEEKFTLLSVLEGAVEITTRAAVSRVIAAGEQVSFTATAIADSLPLATAADAWRSGVLYARQMRLADFLVELSRYRKGVLSCDDAVADIPVSGSFQLANTDSILQLLAETLPVSVSTRSRYWVKFNPQ